MDEHQDHDRREPGAESGDSDPLTPAYGRDFTHIASDPFARFTSWDLPSSIPEANFRSLHSSPSRPSRSADRLSSGSRVDMEQDLLTVEKSRLLEQLRNMTTEVDQLESRLQAVRRRRARAVTSAFQKHQEALDAEDQEMRTILGSVHHLSISNTSERAGATADTAQVSRVPVRTPLSTLSTEALANIDVDMIQRLQSFTNISFTSMRNQLLSTSETGMKARQYNITGICFQLDFRAEFTVREPNLDLKDVRLEVPRSAQTELGRFVSRAKSECMLMPFFRTLTQYAQMDYDRQVLMNNLAKRFPLLVKSNHAIRKLSRASISRSAINETSSLMQLSPAGPGVQTMAFSTAKKSSPELVLQWTIDVTDEGKIVPRVRLLPRMPQKWRQADEKNVLDAIPTQFVRLLQLKGTEGAVAVLLKCVFGRRAAEQGDVKQDDIEDDSAS